ncbi:MAG: hypothetical protein HYU64_18205 [Armatimonadetes bacterium]|nr:hypothetical protein [Armatimonadota bacterium]
MEILPYALLLGSLFSGLAGLHYCRLQEVGLFVLAHLLSSVLSATALAMAFRKSRITTRLWQYLGFGLVFFAPGMGPFGVTLLLILLKVKPSSRMGNLLDEMREQMKDQFHRIKQIRAVEDKRGLLMEHLQVQPLVDMLETSDLQMKRAVISALAEKKGRKMVEKIQECLKDPHPEIYQLALAKLGKLQEDYTKDIARLMASAKENPDSAAAHMELAHLYVDYRESGLLDRTLEDFYWDLAIKEYDEAIRCDPNLSGPLLTIARLHIEKERYEDALNTLNKAHEKSPYDLDIHEALVQTYYGLGQYAAMFRVIREMTTIQGPGGEMDPKVLAMTRWWLAG